MSGQWGKWAPLLVLVGLSTSCVEVGRDRADFDETIGKKTVDKTTVKVTDGLARVVRLDGTQLVLWAQAPSLEIELTMASMGESPITLEIQNCVSDAQLVFTDTQGLSQTAMSTEGDTVTTRRWTLPMFTGTATLQVASPRTAAETPFRFVVFADVQTRLDGVQDLFGPMAREEDVRFGLISGDLTSNGTLADLTRFQREMRTLPFPLYATPGNHELGTDEHHFQRVFGRCSFSFVYGGVRFTLLDSASATLAPKVSQWLTGWLEAGRDALHLVVTHIPPLDVTGARNGAFASRMEGAALVGRLARAGVDLTIYGHVHSYYVFENGGIEAIITGGGGAVPQRFDGIGRHYLMVQADPIQGRFLSTPVRIYPED